MGYADEEEFHNDTYKSFYWRWLGYHRKIERTTENVIRNVVGIIYNSNRTKEMSAYNALRDYPLSIDIINNKVSRPGTFTKADADEVLRAAKEAGWFN